MNLKKLIEQNLAGKKPKWCSHIKFWSRPSESAAEDEYDGVGHEAYGGWSFPSNEAPCGLTNTVAKWKFCPICGTPKP